MHLFYDLNHTMYIVLTYTNEQGMFLQFALVMQ